MSQVRRSQATQAEAFESIKGELGERQQAVLDALTRSGQSLTARQVGHSVCKEIHQISPRLRELMDKGLVVQDGKTQCRFTNRQVSTYRPATQEEQANYKGRKVLGSNQDVSYGVVFNSEAKVWRVIYSGKVVKELEGKWADAVEAMDAHRESLLV